MASKKPFVELTKKEAKTLYDEKYPVKQWKRYEKQGDKHVHVATVILAPGFKTWSNKMALFNPVVRVA